MAFGFRFRFFDGGAAMATPGGADGNIQFNDAGSFGGISFSTVDKAAETIGFTPTGAACGFEVNPVNGSIDADLLVQPGLVSAFTDSSDGSFANWDLTAGAGGDVAMIFNDGAGKGGRLSVDATHIQVSAQGTTNVDVIAAGSGVLTLDYGSGSLKIGHAPQINIDNTNGVRLGLVGNLALFRTDGSAPQISFFGGSTAGKQTVTGAKGGNAALTSLLAALAAYGLITDSTT